MYIPRMNNELDRRFLLGGLAGAAGISALAAMARGGPLTPPAGAVAPSGKTLTEVEPRTPISPSTTPGDPFGVYVISQPGSYYLTGDIAGVAGKAAIRVTAPSATIDMMGFSIIGGGNGIDANQASEGVTVRNGHVRGTSGHGVLGYSGAAGSPSHFECLSVVGASASGILPGNNSIVRWCQAINCAAVGIGAGNRGLVESCIAIGCTNGGIYSGDGACIIRGCVIADNGGPGVFIVIGSGTLVVGNNIRGNGAVGTRGGIRVTTPGNTIEGNVLLGNNYGIETTAIGNLVIGNRVRVGTGNAFELVAGTRYGQIVNLSAAGGAAVSGSAAASTLTSTDPHANFVF
jgi:parallel beta-helix repeat protein